MEYKDKQILIKDLEREFKKQGLYYFDAKEHNKNCPFNYIINRTITVAVICDERDVDNLYIMTVRRQTFFYYIIGEIIYIVNNKFYVFNAQGVSNIRQWFNEVKDNLSVYGDCVNNFSIFTNLTKKYSYTVGRKYSEEDLLKIFQDIVKKLDRVPKAIELKKPEISVYYSMFGSYNNVLEILGYIPHRYRRNIPIEKEKLLQQIRNLTKELGRNPKMSEIDQARRLMKYYGSWHNVLRAANTQNIQKTDNFNKDERAKYLDIVNLAIKNNISAKQFKIILKFIIDILKN